MPPRQDRKRNGLAGPSYESSLIDLGLACSYFKHWGEQVWKDNRLRTYPNHRRHVQEAAEGLQSVINVVPENIPPSTWMIPISWVESRIIGRPEPKHLWRENTANLWWEIIALLTDRWEGFADTEHEEQARKLVDDLTTGAELLRKIRFPNTFDKLL